MQLIVWLVCPAVLNNIHASQWLPTCNVFALQDFGKALARYVIVFNCSDGVDFKMTGKMFAGLAQTGAWACLDEFNRIEVEVLSVVATQIATVMQVRQTVHTRTSVKTHVL